MTDDFETCWAELQRGDDLPERIEAVFRTPPRLMATIRRKAIRTYFEEASGAQQLMIRVFDPQGVAIQCVPALPQTINDSEVELESTPVTMASIQLWEGGEGPVSEADFIQPKVIQRGDVITPRVTIHFS